ncbi:MAG TPA: sortase [Candidatus Dormibacteraeota bacterium]|nr:sortase [Candidatus Dormibacteraeota bacterium]
MDNQPDYQNQPPTNGQTLPPKGNDLIVGTNPAVELIRQKVAGIYANEPDTEQELAEAQAVQPRSKHQQFVLQLSSSGKGLAEIQTAWHNYYVSLPDKEKHEVWQEFYDSSSLAAQYAHIIPSAAEQAKQLVAHKNEPKPSTRSTLAAKARRKLADSRSPQDIKKAIRNKISAGGKLKAKHHLQSLLFGLAIGSIVIFIFLFGFFNEIILAPFIQPGRQSPNTPLILDPNSVAPTGSPEVIIPKINVEIPTLYSVTSINENDIENGLLDGVVHYPTTVLPGQLGNTAFFGHSSNNIFNKGKYKFAFVLLHTLVPGDTFYLTNNNKVYVYKVISKTIVDPSDVSVLGPVPNEIASATLITCDPPGTSLHRLIIVGQQISPDPSANSVGTVNPNLTPTMLPDNGPTLWSKFWHWL